MKRLWSDIKEVLRWIIILPLSPFVLGLLLVLGWIISIGNKVPEDLEEQEGK